MSETKAEVNNAPQTEVTLSVFVMFDKKKLFEQRDDKSPNSRKPMTFRAMTLLEESQFTMTYISNPGLDLTRYDLAWLLCQGSMSQTNPGSDIFGMDWHDLFRDDNRMVKPIAWGIQVNWSNSQRRIQGPVNNFKDASALVDAAFEDMQRHAEKTVSTASGLMLLNGIMQATLQQKRPPVKTAARKEGN